MDHAISTRERILDHGLAMMSQHGLNGVTLGVLAEQVGMSKSGLFAHFKSKEEVQISLLAHSVELSKDRIVAPAMREPEGLPRLKMLIRLWFGWTKRAGLPGGCPIAAGMFEFDDLESPVRDWIVVRDSEWRGFLAQLVKEAVQCRHLKPDLDAEQFAWELCGIYLAHHAAYRFARAPDADKRANTALASLMERSLPVNKAATKTVKLGALVSTKT